MGGSQKCCDTFAPLTHNLSSQGHMPTNIYTVYRITNKVNQKIYVGFTEKSLRERMAQHRRDSLNKSGRKRLFMKAIRKYGMEAFEIEAIYQSEDKEDALEKERHFVKEWNSNHRKIGYNSTFGGENTFHVKGKDHPNWGKKGELARNYGKKLSPEVCENIRKGRQAFYDNGGEPWNKGKKGVQKCTEEARRNMSLAQKRRSSRPKHTEETKRKLSEAKKGVSPDHLNGENMELMREKMILTKRKKNPMYQPDMLDLVWSMRKEGYTAQKIADCISAFFPKTKKSIETFLRLVERDKLYLT